MAQQRISVRRGGPHDLAAIAALCAEVQALHFANRPDQFRAPDPSAIEASLIERFDDDTATFWLAETAGNVAGYVLVVRRERADGPWCSARVWWELDQVSVGAAYRGRGVCRALVERILREARAHGVADLELCSWSFNEAAQAAFRSLGFVPKVVRFELARNPTDD
jgi:ribosomal protein S18 acetylase RimI-like enzyme